MRSRSRALTLAFAVVLVACTAEHPSSTAPAGVTTPARTTSSAPVPVHVTSDLPCDLQRTLSKSCWQCHGSPPQDGVHVQLVTREDLVSPYTRWSPYDRVVDRVIVRMDDDRFPMPPVPDPRVPVDERAAFASWVAEGAPAATEACDPGP